MSGISDEQRGALSRGIECAIGLNQNCGGAEGVYALRDKVLAEVLPHMETAYRLGRMAGASRAGYRLVEKNLELAKKLRELREYAETTDDDGIRTRERVLGLLEEP